MSALGIRKHVSGDSLETEIKLKEVKRVKNDDSDKSDTASDLGQDGDKLQRMSQAIRTVIEVRKTNQFV